MIRNADEFAVVRRQLSLVEDALHALSEDVLPKNARNFDVLAEGYVEQVAILRKEIDAYLGLTAAAAEGIVRSIDLDNQTFVVRGRRGNLPDLTCEYDRQAEERVKACLGRPVRVTGVLATSRKTQREKMEVEAIEVLGASTTLGAPASA